MATKPYVHSHSGIKDFEQCPRKFNATRVQKMYPFEESSASRYGNEVHKAIEDYVNIKKALPPQHMKFKPVVDAILRKPGVAIAEIGFGVKRDLTPCGFFDKDVWLRGKSDLTTVDDDTRKAWVVDFKTGKNKYPDMSQLELMSLFVFAHNPRVERVNSALMFLLYDDLKKAVMLREQVENSWWKVREKTATIERALEVGQFPPKPGPLCGWCPHKVCEHHPDH